MGHQRGRAVRGLCGAATLDVALGAGSAQVDEQGRITLTPEGIRACAKGCVLVTAEIMQAIVRRLEACTKPLVKGGDPDGQGQEEVLTGGARKRPVPIPPVRGI